MADNDDVHPGPESADVLTKYKMGAEMANRKLSSITITYWQLHLHAYVSAAATNVPRLPLGVVKSLTEACIAGAKVLDLCKQGDELMAQETGAVFNKKVDKKPVLKGIAFPTCISINNILFHCCPVEGDAEIVLADGDLVKM